MHARKHWIGGGLALATVVGSIVALLGPSIAVGAAAPLTKAKVRKIVTAVGDARYVTAGQTAYAENDPTPDVDLSGSLAVVLDLAGAGQQLQLSTQRRVFASAVVRARSGPAANTNGITCDISIAGGDGQNTGENTPAQANYDLTLPVADSAVLGAGTHNVQVRCQESAADMQYLLGELLVWTA